MAIINAKRSYTEYIVNTAQSEFAIGFKDYNKDDKDVIHTTIDDKDPTTLGYTVTRISPTVIKLNPAVPVTVPPHIIRLQRETNIDESFHNFTDGAQWNAKSMDENFEQIRHSQQESRDGFIKLRDDVIPLVDGIEDALKTASEAAQAAQDAADAAEEAAQTTRSDQNIILADNVTTQRQFNDKIQKWRQLEATGLIQDLVPRTKNIQYGGDYPNLQAAVDAQRSNTSRITLETNKLYTITGDLNLKGYTYIEGAGFYSRVKLSAGGSVIYTPTGVADDHAQRGLYNFHINGDGTKGDYLSPKDGTTTGYKWVGGAFSETRGMLFNAHDTGMSIESSYTNLNRYNYYRACKVGLRLSKVTSHREELPYMRFNSTAGLLVEDAFQNITVAGGAIEGNIGRGIWIRNIPSTAFPKLVLDDLYMESNGNLAAGVPAVDIPEHDRLHVDVRSGSYWNNQLSGITTGIYRWGTSVAFDNSALNGFHYAKRMRIKDVVDSALYNSNFALATGRITGLVEPATMLEYTPIWRVSGLGVIFNVEMTKKRPTDLFVKQEFTPAQLVYPHSISKSASTTQSENTALNYGDGSWSTLGFSASGDYNNNYAQLTNLLDPSSTYAGKVLVFLVRPTTDCEIGFVSTGTGATQQAYFALKANKTYKLVCPSWRTGAGDYRMRMFSVNGPATVDYLPIYLAQFSSMSATLNFANLFATNVI